MLDSEKLHQSKDQDPAIDPEVDAPALVESAEKSAKRISETQGQMFDDGPEIKDSTQELVEQSGAMPDPSDKAAYKTWLFTYASALKDSGKTWAEIAVQFNSEGIKTLRGKDWTAASMQIFHSRIEKELAKFLP